MIRRIKKIIKQFKERREEKRLKQEKEILQKELLDRIWNLLMTIPKETMIDDTGSRYFVSRDNRFRIIFTGYYFNEPRSILVFEYENLIIKDSTLLFNLEVTPFNEDVLGKIIRYWKEAVAIRKKQDEIDEIEHIKNALK